MPGMNLVSLREVAKNNFYSLIISVRFCFLSSLFAIPIIVGYGIYNIFFGDQAIGYSLIIAGMFFPFFYAPNNWYVFYEGKLDFKSSTYRIIINNIFFLVSILAGLYLKFNLIWIILIYFLINSFFNSFFYLEAKKKILKIADVNKNYKLDIKYAIKCTVQKFTYSFSESVPTLIIPFVFGFESLAIYQIAYFLIALIVGFIAALSTTYMPLLFKYKKINHFKIIWQNLLIGAVFFIGFIIFVKLFFFVFYGENYRESYNLVKIFSFVIIFIPLKSYLFNFFMAKDRNNFLIISNLSANIFALIIFYIIKNTGFAFSIPVYFYLFILLAIIPLLISYFFIASRKTDSILSEIS
jgi:O-antigen/teichoic acid export membrane protein